MIMLCTVQQESCFKKMFSPHTIYSFADRRWTTDVNNNLYTKLGFEIDKILKPDYRYTKGKKIYIHKFNFRKERLLSKYLDILNKSMTESEMAKKLGYERIWDCGLVKYIMNIE